MSSEVRVREVQELAGRLLCPEEVPVYTDVEQWKQIQMHLSLALKELETLAGDSPEEEGERLLALLMGNCVAVRNSDSVSRALERAELVLPLLSDPVLKCKLACFCYLEFPDEELLETVRSCMEEVNRAGRGEEIRQVEKMMMEL